MSKPRVIIRTLEDSPHWLDQHLVAAYLATRYWVGWPDEKGSFLTIESPETAFFEYLESRNIDTCAIITASNPQSRIWTDLENERRNRLLREALQDNATLLLPSKNIAADASWPTEDGCCACGISPAKAVDLGRQFDQNAIVWWEKGEGLALWCL